MSAGSPWGNIAAPTPGQQALRRVGVVYPENIPEALRSREQWLLWQHTVRKGKATKVPYSAHGGIGKSDDPATWTSFEYAMLCYEQNEYSGIGFALAEGDGLVGMDLDKCLDEFGQIHDHDAWLIYERFKDCSYIELSPSGTGLRLFTYGNARQCGKGGAPFEWVEVYDYISPRFLTVTGNVFYEHRELGDGQVALDWLQERYIYQPRGHRDLVKANKRLKKLVLELRAELEEHKQSPHSPDLHSPDLHSPDLSGDELRSPPRPAAVPPQEASEPPHGSFEVQHPRPLIEAFDLGLLDW